MSSIITLLLGFGLGIKHAFEADHVIAISTIVSEQKNPFRSALVGAFWGIGHTTTLFVIGLLVLLFKISIPEHISLSLEFLVGLMLVFLGVYTLLRARNVVHEHEHAHGNITHSHPHVHQDKKGLHQHHKSFLVGSVHGLAGSGALMLLILSTVPTIIEGIYYILLFGLGSIIGMSLMSLLVGLPFIVSTRTFPNIEKHLRIIAGIISILFGMYYMYQVGAVNGLFR